MMRPRKESIARVWDFLADNLSILEPMNGAREAITKLHRRYDLHVITARRKSDRERTEVWLEEHFPGMFSGAHFVEHNTDNSRSKGEVCEELGTVAFIDDSLVNAQDCIALDRQVFLFDKPWNQHPEGEGVIRVFEWAEVLDKLGV